MNIDWNSPWMQDWRRDMRQARLQTWCGRLRCLFLLALLGVLVIWSFGSTSRSNNSSPAFVNLSSQVLEPSSFEDIGNSDVNVELMLSASGYDEDNGILNDPAYMRE